MLNPQKRALVLMLYPSSHAQQLSKGLQKALTSLLLGRSKYPGIRAKNRQAVPRLLAIVAAHLVVRKHRPQLRQLPELQPMVLLVLRIRVITLRSSCQRRKLWQVDGEGMGTKLMAWVCCNVCMCHISSPSAFALVPVLI